MALLMYALALAAAADTGTPAGLASYHPSLIQRPQLVSNTCSCTKQLSKSPCVEGTTFGCLPGGTMWAVGCRGVFTCDGVEGVECSADAPKNHHGDWNHTCKCRPPAPPAPPQPPQPEPPQPVIAAGFFTSNIFWPYDSAQDGTVFACTYLPTLVTANHTRLIAHGSCATEARYCDGFHIAATRAHAGHGKELGAGEGDGDGAGEGDNPIYEGKICQKHSDDGGKTWSPIRLVARGVMTGQIVWDDIHKVLIMHYGTVPPTETNQSPGNGVTLEYRSSDLGDTWSSPRCIKATNHGAHNTTQPKVCADPNTSTMIAGVPKGDGGNTIWTSAGAALQLSPTNKYHPNRLIFTGHVNGCQQWWYSDDGGQTYTFARNASSPTEPLCIIGEGEVGFAETPDGGITSSGRNGVFHGPGKCNCRGVVRSTDGGTTFGELTFDPVLVEPECMATMVNGAEPGSIFHANPGHGTDKESKSPPNGRASGTVRRSTNGGKNWTSVVLNGHNAYSYSCLSKVPQEGFVGLAWETVLPGSDVPKSWSANNVVFTLIPQNFTGH